MGAGRDGYARIRRAYDENVRLGMLVGASETLGYATEALILAGDLDAAQKQLDEALHVADQLGERVYATQLYMMEAAIARGRDERKAAEGSAHRAIAEARAQEAPWLELLALVELCDHTGARTEDRRKLATLVDQLPEARDTAAVARARELLVKAKAV
jgi:hypothetical protein